MFTNHLSFEIFKMDNFSVKFLVISILSLLMISATGTRNSHAQQTCNQVYKKQCLGWCTIKKRGGTCTGDCKKRELTCERIGHFPGWEKLGQLKTIRSLTCTSMNTECLGECRTHHGNSQACKDACSQRTSSCMSNGKYKWTKRIPFIAVQKR